MKICVIGAGLIGSAIAAALAEKGAGVTVVAAERLGDDTSAASLAWLNAADKPPRAYTEMNLNGMRRHAEFAARHTRAPWYHPGGHIRILRNAEERDRWQGILSELVGEDGCSGRWITPAELAVLEPDMNPAAAADAAVAFFPDEAFIQGALLIARRLADARAAGACVLCPAQVAGFRLAGGRIAALQLATGEEIAADAVVNAAGARAGRVAGLAGAHVPMTNEIGLQVYTRPAAVTLAHVLQSSVLNLRPDGGGRICLHDFGTDGLLAPRPGATQDEVASRATGWTVPEGLVQGLLDRLADWFPATRGTGVEGVRLGLRPIPADRKPVVGWFDACPNLYSAVMHSGATQCLWIGELVADEILGDTERAELATFRPGRFAAPPA